MPKPCSRCKRRHVGMVIIPNDGWLLLFRTEWEEATAINDPDLDFLAFAQYNQRSNVIPPENAIRIPWAAII